MSVADFVRVLTEVNPGEDTHSKITTYLLSTSLAAPLYHTALDLTLVDKIVMRLKEQADLHWSINPQISLHCAEKITQLGRTHQKPSYLALGKMALGDALKFTGDNQQAWSALEEAGQLFLGIKDEFGWARTCIGKMWISTELGLVEQALGDAGRAAVIFEDRRDEQMLMRLYWNTAAVHNHVGHYTEALALYELACQKAKSLGTAGALSLGALYSNIGYSYLYLGQLKEAEEHFQQALSLHIEHSHERSIAIENCNLAKVKQLRGAYQPALDLLYKVVRLKSSGLDDVKIFAKRQMAECYLALNRNEDAQLLAQEAIEEFEKLNLPYRGIALTLLCLAEAEIRLRHYEAAFECLTRAEGIYAAQNADSWLAVIHIKRGRIALMCYDADLAQQEAQTAITYFSNHERRIDQLDAELLLAHALILRQEYDAARQLLAECLTITQDMGINILKHDVHLLLGRAYQEQGAAQQAVEHYEEGVHLVEDTHDHLMMTLHRGFLQRENEAFHALIQLHLSSSNLDQAFNMLERMKTQAVLGWFANKQQLLWHHQDDYVQKLFDELSQFKAQHHSWYQSLHRETQLEGKVLDTSRHAMQEILALETQMRQVVEELHVHTGHVASHIHPRYASLEEIQATLPHDTLLLEFYVAEEEVWVFTLDQHSFCAEKLPLHVPKLNQLIEQLYDNVDRALSLSADSPIQVSLTRVFRKISAQLYDGLIRPLVERLAAFKRLVFIPYASLHYLPFNVLYDSQQQCYLVENFEIGLQPAATFMTRHVDLERTGAHVLAYSWDGRLPYVAAEQQIVAQHLQVPCRSQEASIADLESLPGQILHIAAHGEYRMDCPEFSYIQLLDGQLMFDDLLQRDLSYELVTLSCCETGRSHLTTADEPLGLGAGFLYAGARALIVSLWRVHDQSTVELMDILYRNLLTGVSKGEALRQAQCEMLHQDRDVHPAYWGAFQLIGDSQPIRPAM